MALDISLDHLIFDYPTGSGAATYRRRLTSTTNQGGVSEIQYQDISINYALRERSPIHDAFLGGVQERLIDTPWTIPASELVIDAVRFVPQMDDLIVQDSVTYVITFVEQLTLVERYRIQTRRR